MSPELLRSKHGITNINVIDESLCAQRLTVLLCKDVEKIIDNLGLVEGYINTDSPRTLLVYSCSILSVSTQHNHGTPHQN
jgi:hypothetical protein